jgi:hypothetical protein
MGADFFQMAGIREPFLAGIYVTTATFGSSLIGIWLMYKLLGRRPMMLIGTGGATLAFLGIAIAYTIAPGSLEAGKAIVAFAILYTFFSNGFAMNLSWPLANEMVSSRLRIMTFSFATGINYFFSCERL